MSNRKKLANEKRLKPSHSSAVAKNDVMPSTEVVLSSPSEKVTPRKNNNYYTPYAEDIPNIIITIIGSTIIVGIILGLASWALG